MHAPLLPPLLFRQACLLAGMAGLVALRQPVWAGVAALLLWLGMGARARPLPRAMLFALCFCLGLLVAWLRTPAPQPATPQWADSGRPVRFSGTVRECTPATDGRIRLLLGDVRAVASFPGAAPDTVPDADQPPKTAATAGRGKKTVHGTPPARNAAPKSGPGDERNGPNGPNGPHEPGEPDEPDKPGKPDGPPLPGLLALTWLNPSARPAPGTQLAVTATIAPMRGLANPGGEDSTSFWASRDVRFRAWTVRDKGRPVFHGEPSPGWRMREALRTAMLRAIALHDTSPGAPDTTTPDANSTPDRNRTAEATNDAGVAGGQAEPTDRNKQAERTATAGQAGSAEQAERGGGAATPAPAAEPAPLGPSAAFLPALVLGDRFHLDSRDLDLVARASLVHAIALSGMHLCAAAALGAGIALLAGRLAPSVYLYIPRRKLALTAALPPALAYVWLGGAPPSLVRAALMLVFWAWLFWRGHPRVLLDGLLWAVGVIVLLDPGAADDLSLQLSACAVAGIALAAPLSALLPQRLRDLVALAPQTHQTTRPSPAQHPLQRTGKGVRNRIATYAARTLWVTLCIQLALLPLSARVFGTSSPWFGLNLLFLPLIDGISLPLGLAGMALAPVTPEVAGWLLLVARWPFDVLLSALRWLDDAGLLACPQLLRPHPAAMLGFWALLCAAAMHVCGTAHRRAALLLTTGCALVLLPVWPRLADATSTDVRLAVLDVGQGQSAWLDWGGGSMLVDGGGTGSRSWDTGRRVVAPALTDNRPPRLDAVVWSHPDRDHLRGLLYILDTFSVGRAAGNGDAPRGEDAARLTDILRRKGMTAETWHGGQRFELAEGLTLEVLHPARQTGQNEPNAQKGGPARFDGNDASLVLRLSATDGRGNTRGLALLPGDAGDPALRALLDSDVDLSAEVLVLPHHGGRLKTLGRLCDAVRPRVAVASAGFRNRWGFPVADTRKVLAARGIPLLVTAEDGQVRFRWQADGAGRWPGTAVTATAREDGGADDAP